MNPSDPFFVAETKNFQLTIGTLTIVPEYLKGETGYQLTNKRTGVVEQEGNCEASAIRAMHANQKYLDQVLADPNGSKEPQTETIEEYLSRVGSQEPGQLN